MPSAALGFPGHMLSSLLAPIFVLALGVVLMSADTLLGWALLSWFVAGAGFAVLWSHPLAPHWPSLLVIWPALALITALGLERLRVTAMLSFGTWIMQAGVYLIIGLAAGAALLNWVAYVEQGQARLDSVSAVGRQVRLAAHGGDHAVLVNSTPWVEVQGPVIQFLGAPDLYRAPLEVVAPADLPPSLPDGVRLLLLVDDADRACAGAQPLSAGQADSAA